LRKLARRNAPIDQLGCQRQAVGAFFVEFSQAALGEMNGGKAVVAVLPCFGAR
jgi:hypothetical protein